MALNENFFIENKIISINPDWIWHHRSSKKKVLLSEYVGINKQIFYAELLIFFPMQWLLDFLCLVKWHFSRFFSVHCIGASRALQYFIVLIYHKWHSIIYTTVSYGGVQIDRVMIILLIGHS